MDKIIEVKNLVKKYKDVEAVKNISFDVEKGSLFAFLGENGAGKSTTINIICSVLKKTSGKVYVDNLDLDTNSKDIKKIIGIVFQNQILDNELTIKENLETRASFYGMDKNLRKKRILELSELLDLNEIINRKYGQLSGGQRRRCDIARALINTPKILILDEPTTGLDPQTRKNVWKIIDDLRKLHNLTVFLTTHYMEEADNATNVVVMDEGKIKAEGTPIYLKEHYSENKIFWYTPQKKEYDKLIENEIYVYQNGSYQITVKNSMEATRILMKYSNIISDYEVKKGSMDDVFLNITGKKLGE